jgi:hypothetical protein
MPYKLERYGDKAIVVNARSGKHYSTEPIALKSARSQMAALQGSNRYMAELRGRKVQRSEDPKPLLG